MCARPVHSLYTSGAYDVVVLGGGIVGGALAARLASQSRTRPYKVALLEAKPPVLPTTGKDDHTTHRTRPPALRCSALSHNSTTLLHDIGVWDEISSLATPYSSMYVWDWFSRGRVQFNGEEVDSPEGVLGHIVENEIVQSAIFARLSALDSNAECGLELITPAVVEDVITTDSDSEWPSVVLEDGRELRARLLIGADGASSIVKNNANIGTTGRSYGQMGVVASVRCSGMQRTAWQRFLPTGPIALLPFGDDFASIVWSVPSATAKQLKQLAPEDFVTRVQAALETPSSEISGLTPFRDVLPESFGSLLPTLLGSPRTPPQVQSLESAIAAFPLRAELADNLTSNRIALIGDAAHVVHPMAGQGLNLGLYDSSLLADIISNAAATGQDIGSQLLLNSYERKARRHAQLIVGGVDVLKSVFEMDAGPAALLRNIGMDVVDAVPELKKKLARVAMGL